MTCPHCASSTVDEQARKTYSTARVVAQFVSSSYASLGTPGPRGRIAAILFTEVLAARGGFLGRQWGGFMTVYGEIWLAVDIRFQTPARLLRPTLDLAGCRPLASPITLNKT
jgi:hypothetical protein